MKLSSVILVLVILTFSCKEKNKPLIKKDTYTEVTKSKTVEADTLLSNNNFFNEKKFLKLINNNFSDTNEKFVLNKRKIENSILKHNNVLRYITSKEMNTEYYFYDGIKSNIELFIVKNLGNNVDSVYQEIKKLGYCKDRKSDPVPGLSYANDYILKTENDIYWLNSPCSISYNNHLKISEILKILIQSESKNNNEHFFCKCGNVLCE